jgi:molybdenum cofactor cytidylyltransferase
MRAYAVVLAAGRGSRFGGDKLLVPWHGQPLLAHTVAAVRGAVDAGALAGGCVVAPAGHTRLQQLARDAGFTPIENPAPAEGLAGSLRLGIGWLEKVAPADTPAAAVICLGDQPLVRPPVVARLVATWGGGRVAAVRPRYGGAPDEPGHPTLVDRSLWPLAAHLAGDSGFGPVLAACGVTVETVDVPGINPDVDTPADLARLQPDDDRRP